ncbi:hypothetical protein ACWGLG_16605 [Streptomyces antimycoticus]
MNHGDGNREQRPTPTPADRADRSRETEFTCLSRLEEARTIVRRLAAHAAGFQDVLDESDRDPWGRLVGADIAALSAALSRVPQVDEMGDREAVQELRAEGERLIEVRDGLLRTLNELGEARAKDHEVMRDMRYELEWRRKVMGDLGLCTCDHPHASHILKAGPQCDVIGCGCQDYAPRLNENPAP